MNLPAVHNCLRLSDENDLLLRKLKKMRFKNEQLEAELTRMQEQLRLQQLMRDYVMTRDSQVQTESQLWCGRGGGIKEPKGASGNKNGKLLQMYNNLQKRYDNEIKRNQVQSEAITSLTVKIHELELQLQVANQKMQQLECKKVCKHTQTILKGRTSTPEMKFPPQRSRCKKSTLYSNSQSDLLLVIEKLKKEREKLYKEKRMLLKELAGLDKEFFDEIEDLKFALQESVKLNNQYEKCLNQISTKFGLPCAEISEVPVT
ncbi:uncharacterized protein LOC115460315 isoform X1 [Microcaecilia unicolor]|uniref:Uncharacterized protein LOC115460315 isoform X1 n=1 Tax=Microcaecilia unicolor TaxID=1415580 RepID=A0A6P7WS10_9AMPH|nr:uncharacterized protein LOC115460315 isoform X1 [Microcaecilia unicolor]